YGLGRHASTLSPEDLVLYQRVRKSILCLFSSADNVKAFFVSLFFYITTLAVVKLVFLLQYYRIMSVSNMRRVYIAMIVLVAVWGIGQGTFALVACIPLEGFWNPGVHAKCVPNAHIAWYISALFNIFTDIIIMILPLPVIRKLKLPGSQKAFLFGIFSVGFLTVAISAMRIKFLTLLPDPTWSNFEPVLWSLAELTSAITCASLATLRPLLTRLSKSRGRISDTESVAQMVATNKLAGKSCPQVAPSSTGTRETLVISSNDINPSIQEV
ncbi:integral membrane protein, partial [Colletotrichum asianum]